MQTSPLSAAATRKPWLFLLAAIVVICMGGISMIITLWNHNHLLFSERERAVMLFVQTHSLTVTLGVELLSSFLFLVMFWRLQQRAAHRFHKKLDSERVALMELATHQLGAPLASLRWWLEMLKDPQNDTNKTEVLQEIETALLRMDALVHSLTNAQKIDLNALTSEFNKLSSLKFLIYDAISDFPNDVKLKELKFDVQDDPAMPPLTVDPLQVSDVLHECIENAISFSPGKSTISIIVTTDRSNHVVQVEVRDQGIGIPSAEQARIFEKLFRASNATSIKPVGNGLGLYNVKSIIESQGGQMWIKSKEGKGTSVFFTLPFENNQ